MMMISLVLSLYDPNWVIDINEPLVRHDGVQVA